MKKNKMLGSEEESNHESDGNTIQNIQLIEYKLDE